MMASRSEERRRARFIPGALRELLLVEPIMACFHKLCSKSAARPSHHDAVMRIGTPLGAVRGITLSDVNHALTARCKFGPRTAFECRDGNKSHGPQSSTRKPGFRLFNVRRMTMLSRITLVLALAITAITMIVPASARTGDAPYGGYEDGAYNRNGW
jgi:hypothetical protein